MPSIRARLAFYLIELLGAKSTLGDLDRAVRQGGPITRPVRKLKRHNRNTPPKGLLAHFDYEIQQVENHDFHRLKLRNKAKTTVIYLHGGAYVVGPMAM